MRQEIENAIADVVRAAEFLKEPLSCDFIETASVPIAECFQSGGKFSSLEMGGVCAMPCTLLKS